MTRFNHPVIEALPTAKDEDSQIPAEFALTLQRFTSAVDSLDCPDGCPRCCGHHPQGFSRSDAFGLLRPSSLWCIDSVEPERLFFVYTETQIDRCGDGVSIDYAEARYFIFIHYDSP